MEEKKIPWYDKIEKFMLIAEFLLCLAILAFNVFTRTFLSYTASWSEQAARLLFIWMSFTACSLCGMNSNHLMVTAVDMIHNEKLVKTVYWIGDIISVLFCIFISTRLFSVFMTVYKSHQMFTGIPWMPAWIQYLAGLLGLPGYTIRVIQRRVRMVMADKKKEVA